MDNPSDLAATAFEYGPFLFAILFVTGLTAIAQRAYSRAEKPEQIRAFRIYFFTSFFFGLILVTICVSTWINDREFTHRYVYTFEIQNVPPQVSFWSSEACITKAPISDGVPVETVRAIYVEKTPLSPGSGLTITESPESAGPGAAGTVQGKEIVLKVANPNTMLDFRDLPNDAANAHAG